LYLLLTLAASAIVEFLSNWRNWRAQMLFDAIRNMLSGAKLITVDDVYSNPLVAALARNDAAPSRLDFLERFGWRPIYGGKAQTMPSYIPAATFAGAILDEMRSKATAARPSTAGINLDPAAALNLIKSALSTEREASIAASPANVAAKVYQQN